MTSAVDPVTAKRRHLRIANTLDLEGVSDTAVVSAIWKRRERKSHLSERVFTRDRDRLAREFNKNFKAAGRRNFHRGRPARRITTKHETPN